jgi:hypothetical protein
MFKQTKYKLGLVLLFSGLAYSGIVGGNARGYRSISERAYRTAANPEIEPTARQELFEVGREADRRMNSRSIFNPLLICQNHDLPKKLDKILLNNH